MPIPFLLLLLLACCLGASAYAQEAPPADVGASPPVRYRVEVDAPKALAEMLRTGLDLVRWEQDPQMNAELLQRLVDEAQREAKEAVATEGYFSARVDASIDRSVAPWVVRLRVEPGPRTRVTEVEIRFTGPAADDEGAREWMRRVRQNWPLRQGQPFRQAEWDAAKQQAARTLASWRYASAHVGESRALVDPEQRSAALSVEIASGPPFRFGPVHVIGVKRYPEQLVRNMSPAHPGEMYDRQKLLLYQRRLVETGYFVSAQVDIETDPSQAEGAPVRVAVIEGSTQHIETGVGYSTDTGARLELQYSNVDVFDSAWRLRSGLRLDRKIQNLQIDLDAPPRPDGSWNSGFARARRSEVQNERTSEIAFGVAHNWGLERTPSALLASAHFEEQRVAGDGTDNRHALFFGYRRTFRRTDDVVSPRSGYLGMIELGGAPPGVSSRQFARATASGSLFFPVGRDDLLLRAQAGVVLAASRQGIPSTFLFRTGGDQTVRGYAFESLGVAQGEAIVGGRRLAIGSVEYTHWIGGNWGIAAFVDAGNAWDSGREHKLALGYGVGPRFRTPIGPIRADFAYGQDTRKLRVHFSIGYTF